MKKYLILLITAILLISCDRGTEVSSEQIGDFKLELLFEKDGCKVFRFYDAKWIYWSNCEGSLYEQHREGSGKSGHEISIQSLTNKNHIVNRP